MAAQDEALLDAVIASDKVSDEVIGFHCQQAAEKMLRVLRQTTIITVGYSRSREGYASRDFRSRVQESAESRL